MTGTAGRDAGQRVAAPAQSAGTGSAWPAFLGGLGLIALFGFAAWGLREELAPGLGKVWPIAPPPAEKPAAALPPDLVHRPEPARPKPRQWTVPEISAAVTGMPGQLEELVAEAQKDLRGLVDPGAVTDAAQEARARMFFNNWGTAFGNQLKALKKKMPPQEQCQPYSSMVKGCRAIHIAFEDLQRAPNMTTVKAARTTLDAAVKDLKAALAPPPAAAP